MKKTEIYDHIAKTYLNDPSKQKKNQISGKSRSGVFYKLGFFFTSALVIFLIVTILWQGKPSQSRETTAVIDSEIIKMDHSNFSQTKKEIFTFDISNVDFFNYKTFGFSARKSNYCDKIRMRVELIDSFGQQSRVYVTQLPAYEWKDFEIKLDEFKGFGDMSEICLLTFMVEDWKTKGNRSLLYIDNVRFLQ